MWDWLSKIDPTVAVTVLTTVGGWLWNKARGKKTESLQSIIGSMIDNLVHELVDSYSSGSGIGVADYLKTARKYIDERAWTVLKKRGVPRNAETEKLLHQAIERGTAWLANEVRSLKTQPK
jgi:hypothetical protein